jgi:hypothetical protein
VIEEDRYLETVAAAPAPIGDDAVECVLRLDVVRVSRVVVEPEVFLRNGNDGMCMQLLEEMKILRGIV